MENLGNRRKAVGSAGCVGYDVKVGLVVIVVDSEDKEWGVVLGWRRDDHLLGTTGEVLVTGLSGEELAG